MTKTKNIYGTELIIIKKSYWTSSSDKWDGKEESWSFNTYLLVFVLGFFITTFISSNLPKVVKVIVKPTWSKTKHKFPERRTSNSLKKSTNWTYIKLSEDVLNVFWMSYKRSIYTLSSEGNSHVVDTQSKFRT